MRYDEALAIAEVARTAPPALYEEYSELAIQATLAVVQEERKAPFQERV